MSEKYMDLNIQNRIKELQPWYQQIDINGVITVKSRQSNILLWNKICKIVGGKDKFRNSKVLDLGCNAGLYSVMSALSGAGNVIGIESTPIFFKQALFVKECFEKIHKIELPITYIQDDISNINLENLGKFDYVFALAVLYHIGKFKYGKYTERALLEQENVIKKLCKICNCIIVRGRKGKYSNEEWYNPIFKKFNFFSSEIIDEGKRILIKYEKKGS